MPVASALSFAQPSGWPFNQAWCKHARRCATRRRRAFAQRSIFGARRQQLRLETVGGAARAAARAAARLSRAPRQLCAASQERA